MNNWYVITGAFSSGKTTLLNALQALGHRVVPEAARALIDEELAAGKTLKQIRWDEAAFQERVLAKKLDTEHSLPAGELIFFDRGIPDTIAYLRLGGFDVTRAVLASRSAHYRAVLLLDPLPYDPDYARTETAEQIQMIDRLLETCYQELGYDIHRVPVMPVARRLQVVLERVQ